MDGYIIREESLSFSVQSFLLSLRTASSVYLSFFFLSLCPVKSSLQSLKTLRCNQSTIVFLIMARRSSYFPTAAQILTSCMFNDLRKHACAPGFLYVINVSIPQTHEQGRFLTCYYLKCTFRIWVY